MARQVGEYRYEGRIDGLCFYKMEGEYFVRTKSSLTGKRFWKAACFEGSRRSCHRLARGSQLAAIVYKNCTKQDGLYAALKTKAIGLLKKNKAEEKVIRTLVKLALQLQPVKLHAIPLTKLNRGEKQKAKDVPSLYRIPPVNGRIDFFNRYLSSA